MRDDYPEFQQDYRALYSAMRRSRCKPDWLFVFSVLAAHGTMVEVSASEAKTARRALDKLHDCGLIKSEIETPDRRSLITLETDRRTWQGRIVAEFLTVAPRMMATFEVVEAGTRAAV